jgi:hypothetical protein
MQEGGELAPAMRRSKNARRRECIGFTCSLPGALQ